MKQEQNASAYLDEDDRFLLKKDGADGDPKAIEAEAEADPEASDKGPLRPRTRSLIEHLVGHGHFFPFCAYLLSPRDHS